MNARRTVDGGDVVCLVLAAGAGSRFGSRKQLAALAGRPLLEHAVGAAVASTADRVLVVLGADAEAVGAGVELGRAEAVICDRWSEGLAASLRRGIAAAGAAEAAVVVLGDAPLITAAAIDRVVSAREPGRAAVRATYGGRPGHPVVLERVLFESAARLRGDAGARGLLDGVDVVEVPCDDVADPLDVDSPAHLELAAARLSRRRG